MPFMPSMAIMQLVRHPRDSLYSVINSIEWFGCDNFNPHQSQQQV